MLREVQNSRTGGHDLINSAVAGATDIRAFPIFTLVNFEARCFPWILLSDMHPFHLFPHDSLALLDSFNHLGSNRIQTLCCPTLPLGSGALGSLGSAGNKLSLGGVNQASR